MLSPSGGNPITVPAIFGCSEREKSLQQSMDSEWRTLLQRRILTARRLVLVLSPPSGGHSHSGTYKCKGMMGTLSSALQGLRIGDTPTAKGFDCPYTNREDVRRLVPPLTFPNGGHSLQRNVQASRTDGGPSISKVRTRSRGQSHSRGFSTSRRLIERELVGWCLR